MFADHLKCVSCNTTFPLDNQYECLECGNIIEVQYDYDKIAGSNLAAEESTRNYYWDLLPVNKKKAVSIGEGQTALVKSQKLAKRIGLKKLFFKCEFSNPTGSFKDRPVSVGMSKAVEFGYDKAIVASSGNGAGSVAAYAARAGIEAIVLVPEETPLEKVTQACAYGAKVIKVQGPYSNCFNLAKAASEQFNIFNLTTTFINPYTVEGDKLVSFELIEQMGGTIPDIVYVPIGAGPLLVGIHKGYREYKRLFNSTHVPKMAGIQAEGCSPIAQAFLAGKSSVTAVENPHTIAGGICDGLYGYSKDGTHTLNIIKQSNGFALFVSDHQIKEAQEWLAEDEGLFVEPSAAAGVAALVKSLKEKRIHNKETIVVILTGHGLKDMSQLTTGVEIPTISNEVNQLIKMIT